MSSDSTPTGAPAGAGGDTLAVFGAAPAPAAPQAARPPVSGAAPAQPVSLGLDVGSTTVKLVLLPAPAVRHRWRCSWGEAMPRLRRRRSASSAASRSR